jgi:hypothetical protein
MQHHRALILRSNRFLGSSLVDKGLITSAHIEAANVKFMEMMQSPETIRNASILSTILFDHKVLEEGKLIDLIVEESKIGLVDLAQIQLQSLRPMEIDLDACSATWTMPFDHLEGTFMLATCYYLSAPVIKYWEELLDGEIIWYATTLGAMVRALETVQDLHEAEDLAEAEAIAEEAEIAAAEAEAKAKIDAAKVLMDSADEKTD